MSYFDDLSVDGEVVLAGGGRVLADVVTAARTAGLHVPDDLVVLHTRLEPDESRRLAVLCRAVTVPGAAELGALLDGIGERTVDFERRPQTLEGWRADAVDYFRGLGFFCDGPPALDELDVAEADLQHRGEQPDLALLPLDRGRVLDACGSPRCAAVLDGLVRIGHCRYRLTVEDFDELEPWQRTVVVSLTIDGRRVRGSIYTESKHAIRLDCLLPDINRALTLAGSQQRIWLLGEKLLCVLTAREVERLQRDRELWPQNPARVPC